MAEKHYFKHHFRLSKVDEIIEKVSQENSLQFGFFLVHHIEENYLEYIS